MYYCILLSRRSGETFSSRKVPSWWKENTPEWGFYLNDSRVSCRDGFTSECSRTSSHGLLAHRVPAHLLPAGQHDQLVWLHEIPYINATLDLLTPRYAVGVSPFSHRPVPLVSRSPGHCTPQRSLKLLSRSPLNLPRDRLVLGEVGFLRVGPPVWKEGLWDAVCMCGKHVRLPFSP